MSVKKGKEFLPDISLKQLENTYAQEKNAKAKIRLQCAILRKKGNNQVFIAEVTGLPVSTVSDILRRCDERGLKGCNAIKQKGQPQKLSPIQRAKLKKIISQSPQKLGLPFIIWTTKLAQYIIHKMFNIDYVIMQVHRILKSLELSLQKARPEHIKANKKLQAQFKKNFDEELKSLENSDMRSYFWTKAPSNSNHSSSKVGS